MDNFYLILVVVLFALAISDLIVGVSNDAVNFLNSAIGAKAAPKWIIFTVAGLGVLIGATFSSGMMEVARKGIFHPDMFYFKEIMIIFIAVMITDIILLDAFNTFGLPTSTTVSIVFELLGAAIAVSIVKLQRAGESFYEFSKYINSEKAVAIIGGILLSVVVAFCIGAIIQWITRVIFTFNFKKKAKYYTPVFGGVAIAIITHFIIVKGAKGASWLSEEQTESIKENVGLIFLYSFLGWSAVLQIARLLFKRFDVLKFIVLIGTFSLAMAFAGNDLVNFIGVPLAGLESFKAWSAAGSSPDFAMEVLNEPVRTNTYILIIAGVIMMVTLVTSRKARSVVATTVNLSRQNEGDERFAPSVASRALVRSAILTGDKINRVLGKRVVSWISSRFEQHESGKEGVDYPAFDKVRATSNLVVASALISIGTSLKLPLSTTYVTFMVAMGTSLADKAWDRESAVYRISGVFAVVGGWFLTALVAFSVSGFVGFVIAVSGKFMVFVFVGVAIFMVARTYMHHRKRELETHDEDDFPEPVVGVEKVLAKSNQKIINVIISSSKVYYVAFDSFFEQNRKKLGAMVEEVKSLDRLTSKLRAKIPKIVHKLQVDDSFETTGHHYAQVVGYLCEMSQSVKYVIRPLYDHLDNNHKPFVESQVAELKQFRIAVSDFFNLALHIVKESRFEQVAELISKRQEIVSVIQGLGKNQVKRIKREKMSSRNSMLYFNIMSETKNLLLQTENLVNSTRDFTVHTAVK